MRHDCGCRRTAVLFLLAMLLVSRPALAQFDISGEWAKRYNEDAPHRGSVEIGDYTGLPINDAARLKATTWDENVQSTPERQCIPHVGVYQMRGPSNFRINKVADRLGSTDLLHHTAPTAGRAPSGWTGARTRRNTRRTRAG